MGDMNMNESETLDIRAALRKGSAAMPDVDKEWARFKASHSAAAPHKLSRAACLWGGVAIGIAATVLFTVFLLPHFKTAEAEPLVVFTAEEQPSYVEMTSTPIALSSANGKGTVHNAQPKTEKVGQDIIDMRLAAASDTATERIVHTPRGKDMKIVLSDGSEVLLNADSKLRFPTRFNSRQRTVVLEGEAYFTVAKNEKCPFIVRSGNLTTTALGTEFNVQAYGNKPACVTLITGSVAVNDASEGQKVVLQPGQDASLVDGKLIVADANPRTFTYWKEGFFYFDNVPLVDILMELGRWYNVTIELQSRELMSYRLHFAADRSRGIDEAIERLNKFSYLHATLNGEKVVVDKVRSASK